MNPLDFESLFLSQKDIDKINSFAESEYPYECCGIVIGEENGFNNIVKYCENIQNKLHKSDPEKFTRDAKTAYYIDPMKILDITKEANEKNMKMKVFFHSHPEHDVYFSEEDKKNALFFDTPSYPGVTYIIASVYNKKVKDIGCFLWDKSKKDFVKL